MSRLTRLPQKVITSNLFGAPLTIVYGESGVGKSSILLASVDPALREEPDTVVVVFREWQSPNFLAELKVACLKEVESVYGKKPDIDPNLPLDDILAQASELSDCTIIFLFDQFEEFFLYHPASRTEFDAEVARAINRRDTDCSFLLVLREDALAKLNDRFRTRIRNLMGNTVRLTHLNRASSERAIREPLVVYNNEHPDGRESPVDIEESLVPAILEQVRSGKVQINALGGVGGVDLDDASVPSQDDDTHIETPFLQLVMTRLWEEEIAADSSLLRLATLERLGNAENIVRTHLDRSMTSLAASEQEICAKFFDRLVTPTGNKIACSAGDLRGWAGLSDDDQHVNQLLISLCDSRVLRGVSPLPGETEHRYEIFHDVLAQAILAWRARYLEEQATKQAQAEAAERERQANLERIAEVERLRAEEQQRVAEVERQRAESERQRKRAFALTALVIAVAAIVVWYTTSQSEKKMRVMATEQQTIAETRKWTIDAINKLTTEPQKSVEWALRAVTRIDPLYAGVGSENQQSSPCQGAVQGAFCQAQQTLHLSTQAMARHFTLVGHTDMVTDVTFNAHGTRLATASADGTAKVWAIDSEQPILSLVGHRKAVTSIVFSPDRQHIATGSEDGTAKIWDVIKERQVDELEHGQVITDLAFSPDSKLLVTASVDGKARLWALDDTSKPTFITPDGKAGGHDQVITSVAFSPDGQYLATASQDEKRTINIWQVKDHELLTPPISTIDVAARIVHLDFSPDSQWLAAASQKRDDVHLDDGFAAVWETQTGDVVWAKLDSEGTSRSKGVNNVMFSPSGRFLITSRDTALRVWRMDTGEAVWDNPFEAHGESITRMVLAPNGITFASASYDKTAKVWQTPWQDDWQTLDREPLVTLPSSAVQGFTFTSDRNDVIRVGMFDDSSQVLSILTGNRVAKGLDDIHVSKRVGTFIPLKDDRAIAIAFGHGGSYVASAHTGSYAVVWDIENGQRVFRTPIAQDERQRVPITSVMFSPDDQHLATGSADGRVIVWKWQSGAQSKVLEGHEGQVTSLAFDASGDYLATASTDKRSMVWHLKDGSKVFETPKDAHSATILSVAMHPEGTQLATASLDKTAKVWNLESKSLLYTMAEHRDSVSSIAFSPDGRRLLTGSEDKTVKMWSSAFEGIADGTQPEALLTLTSHDRAIQGVKFSPDGAYFASSSDQVVRVYPVGINDLMDKARKLLEKPVSGTKASDQ